ncbi:MAG: alpha/beta hydrolase [Pseudomonadota bacterium]
MGQSTLEAWRGFTRQQLEQQYSPSSCVDDFDALMVGYATESRASEARAHVQKDLAYGGHTDETLDLFSAGDGTALQVFIHGGYWQALSKDDSTFPGADFVANGVSYAAVNYSLAPAAGIVAMIRQCRRSIAWLYHHASELGFDRDRIVISGSSAGAHLAVMVMLTDWPAFGVPRDVIKGATLMSGVFDLRPLCHTYVNEPLGLVEAGARALSPLFHTLAGLPETIVCWGENETDEFKRQSQAFFMALRDAGIDAIHFEVEGHNHFDLVQTLSDPESVLGGHAYRQIRSLAG